VRSPAVPNPTLKQDCAKIARVFPDIIGAKAPNVGVKARSPLSTLNDRFPESRRTAMCCGSSCFPKTTADFDKPELNGFSQGRREINELKGCSV